MKHQGHFATTATPREAVQIGQLIADLDRIVRLLNNDIAAEEERARVFDPSSAKYPAFARTLLERRENLAATIAELEVRRAGIHSV
jgi:hypothetical protein